MIWGKENLRFKINEHIKRGENTIAVRTRFPEWWPEKGLMRAGVDPVVLVGEFTAKKEGRIWQIYPEAKKLRTGSWHEQGYYNYAGTGIYEQVIDLPSPEKKVFLKTDKVRDVLEVWINDQKAGVRPWPPFTVDITDHIHKGANKLTLKVTNTMQNLFSKPNPSGLLGSCSIIVEK